MRPKRYLPLFWLLIFGISFTHAQPASLTHTNFDAIFWVDTQTQTTTAAYGVGFSTEDLTPQAWLFPVPPNAKIIGTAPSLLATVISRITPQTLSPIYHEHYCDLSPILEWYSYGWSILAEEEVDAQVNLEPLSGEQASTFFDDQAQAIQHYSATGWTWVSMSVQPRPEPPEGFNPLSAFIQRPPMLLVRYAGTTPLLPLGLYTDSITVLDEEYYRMPDHLRVRVTVLSDRPYTSDALTTANMSQLSAPFHAVDRAMQLTTSPSVSPPTDLYNYLNTLANSNGLIRHYVAESPNLHDDSYRHFRDMYPEAVDFFQAQRLPMISIFDAILQPRLETIAFTPDPHLTPPFSDDPLIYPNADLFNPLDYWGCTTNALHDPTLEAVLPAGSSYLRDFGLLVRHPEAWGLSTINDRVIFAPETVDLADLQAMERGEIAFPALVISRQRERYHQGGNPSPIGEWVGLTSDQAIPPTYHRWIYAPEQVNWVSDSDLAEDGFTGILIGLFAPSDTPEADGEVYRAMVRYLDTRQFITSPYLRHTLYLRVFSGAAAIGYPQGWEAEATDDMITIRPLDLPIEQAPLIQLERQRRRNPISVSTIQPYESADRRGLVVLTGIQGWSIALISVPSAQFEAYAPLLHHLAESLRPYQPHPLTGTQLHE